MLDAIIFEKRGIPAAAILTEPFRQTGEALAELQGMPGYAFVTVPHPITSLTAQEVEARADLATSFVEALLVEGAALPAADDGRGASTALGDVVEDLAHGLRSDGADLYGEHTGAREITLRLHIPDAACAECILPARVLLPIFERRVDAMIGPGYHLRLDDPREGGIVEAGQSPK